MSDYENKFSEMRKYIPFLESMIQRLETNKSADRNPREAQLSKIKALRDLLLDNNKRMKMDNLLKCEQVLINLHSKVEQTSILPSSPISGKSEEASIDKNTQQELQTVREKLKVVTKISDTPNTAPDYTVIKPNEQEVSNTEEINKEAPLFQRRPQRSPRSKSITPVATYDNMNLLPKRNYTRVLVSPEPDKNRWNSFDLSRDDSVESETTLFQRRSPRRRARSRYRKERKGKKKTKHDSVWPRLGPQVSQKSLIDNFNITLDVPEEKLNSLNTNDILDRIVNCNENDVDIDHLKTLRSKIVQELRQTGANQDISDYILKSYRKKKFKEQHKDEVEEGELSESESESIEKVYGNLVIELKNDGCDKDKKGRATPDCLSLESISDAESEPPKIKISLTISNPDNVERKATNSLEKPDTKKETEHILKSDTKTKDLQSDADVLEIDIDSSCSLSSLPEPSRNSPKNTFLKTRSANEPKSSKGYQDALKLSDVETLTQKVDLTTTIKETSVKLDAPLPKINKPNLDREIINTVKQSRCSESNANTEKAKLLESNVELLHDEVPERVKNFFVERSGDDYLPGASDPSLKVNMFKEHTVKDDKPQIFTENQCKKSHLPISNLVQTANIVKGHHNQAKNYNSEDNLLKKSTSPTLQTEITTIETQVSTKGCTTNPNSGSKEANADQQQSKVEIIKQDKLSENTLLDSPKIENDNVEQTIPFINEKRKEITTPKPTNEEISQIEILTALKNDILGEALPEIPATLKTPPLHQPKVSKVSDKNLTEQERNKKIISLEKYKQKMPSGKPSQSSPSIRDGPKKDSRGLTAKEFKRFQSILKSTLDVLSDEESQELPSPESISPEDVYDDLGPKSPEDESFPDFNLNSPIMIPMDPISKDADADSRKETVNKHSVNISKSVDSTTGIDVSPKIRKPGNQIQAPNMTPRPMNDRWNVDFSVSSNYKGHNPKPVMPFPNSTLVNTAPNARTYEMAPHMTPSRMTPSHSNLPTAHGLMTPSRMTPSHYTFDNEEFPKRKHVYAPSDIPDACQTPVWESPDPEPLSTPRWEPPVERMGSCTPRYESGGYRNPFEGNPSVKRDPRLERRDPRLAHDRRDDQRLFDKRENPRCEGIRPLLEIPVKHMELANLDRSRHLNFESNMLTYRQDRSRFAQFESEFREFEADGREFNRDLLGRRHHRERGGNRFTNFEAEGNEYDFDLVRPQRFGKGVFMHEQDERGYPTDLGAGRNAVRERSMGRSLEDKTVDRFPRESSLSRVRETSVGRTFNRESSVGRNVVRERSVGRSFTREPSVGRTFNREPNVSQTNIRDLNCERDDNRPFYREKSIGRTFLRESSVGRALHSDSFETDRRFRGQSIGRTFQREKSIIPKDFNRQLSETNLPANKRHVMKGDSPKLQFTDDRSNAQPYNSSSYKIDNVIVPKVNSPRKLNVVNPRDPRSRRDFLEQTNKAKHANIMQDNHKPEAFDAKNSYGTPNYVIRDPRWQSKKNRNDPARNFGDKSKESQGSNNKPGGIVYTTDNIAKGTIIGQGYGVKNYKIPKIKRVEPEPEKIPESVDLTENNEKEVLEEKMKPIENEDSVEIQLSKTPKQPTKKKQRFNKKSDTSIDDEAEEKQKAVEYVEEKSQITTLEKSPPVKRKTRKVKIFESDSDSDQIDKVLIESALEKLEKDFALPSENENTIAPVFQNENDSLLEQIENKTLLSSIQPIVEAKSQANERTLISDVEVESCAKKDGSVDTSKQDNISANHTTKTIDKLKTTENIPVIISDVTESKRNNDMHEEVIAKANLIDYQNSTAVLKSKLAESFAEVKHDGISIPFNVTSKEIIGSPNKALDLPEINLDKTPSSPKQLPKSPYLQAGRSLDEPETGNDDLQTASLKLHGCEDALITEPILEGSDANNDTVPSVADSTIYADDDSNTPFTNNATVVAALPDSTELDTNSIVSSSQSGKEETTDVVQTKMKSMSSLENVLSILQNKSKIKEILTMLGDSSTETTLKKKLEKLAALESDEENEEDVEPDKSTTEVKDKETQPDPLKMQPQLGEIQPKPEQEINKTNAGFNESENNETVETHQDQTIGETICEDALPPLKKKPGRRGKRVKKVEKPIVKRVTRASISKKSKNRELQNLQDDIRDMFISKEVLSATGIRMCRIAKLVNDKPEKVHEKDSGSFKNTLAEPIVVLQKTSILDETDLQLKQTEIAAKTPTELKVRKKPGSKPKPKNVALPENINNSFDTLNLLVEKPAPKSKKIFKSKNTPEDKTKTSQRSLADEFTDSEDESLSSLLSFGSSEQNVETVKVKTKRKKSSWKMGVINKAKPKKKKQGDAIKEDVKKDDGIKDDVKKDVIKADVKKDVIKADVKKDNVSNGKVSGEVIKKNVQDLLDSENIPLNKRPGYDSYTDKEYCFTKSGRIYSCSLCSVDTVDIVCHYREEHPHSEIPLSRPSDKMAKAAIEEALATDFQAFNESPKTVMDIVCRFCYLTTKQQNNNLEDFFLACCKDAYRRI